MVAIRKEKKNERQCALLNCLWTEFSFGFYFFLYLNQFHRKMVTFLKMISNWFGFFCFRFTYKSILWELMSAFPPPYQRENISELKCKKKNDYYINMSVNNNKIYCLAIFIFSRKMFSIQFFFSVVVAGIFVCAISIWSYIYIYVRHNGDR